ncbi:hypothetical protein SS50377_27691 [Spironucleus salmonicida]|uniref:Uncharacterized protein n=1 Tax=Spironucleus salmonicida TaxID=348837 RepID=V6LQK8_9EUKA|nr:hypothetical protein SS50377_27691 [Spironucleus salmonicida]|eukprot:EST46533.1 hypothetical protein SS50377_13338 [Spironucleus salmonicida]
MPITHYNPQSAKKPVSPRTQIALARLGMTVQDTQVQSYEELFAKYRDHETVLKTQELQSQLTQNYLNQLSQEYENITQQGISQEEFIYANKPQALENLVITNLTISQLDQRNKEYEINTKLNEAKRVQILHVFHQRQDQKLSYLNEKQQDVEKRRLELIRQQEEERQEKILIQKEKQQQIQTQIANTESQIEKQKQIIIDSLLLKNEKMTQEKLRKKQEMIEKTKLKWQEQQNMIVEAEKQQKLEESRKAQSYQNKIQQEKLLAKQREQQIILTRQQKLSAQKYKDAEQAEKLQKLSYHRENAQKQLEISLQEKQEKALQISNKLKLERTTSLLEKQDLLNLKITQTTNSKQLIFEEKLKKKQQKLAQTERVFEQIERGRRESQSMIIGNQAEHDLELMQKFQNAEMEKRKREFQRQLGSIKVQEKQEEILRLGMQKQELSCQHVQNSVRFASLDESDKLRISQLQVQEVGKEWKEQLEKDKKIKKFPRVEYGHTQTQRVVPIQRPMSGTSSQRGTYQEKLEWKSKIESLTEKHISIMEKRVLEQQKREIQMQKELCGILTVTEKTKILQSHKKERDQMRNEMQQMRKEQLAEIKHMYFVLEKRFQGV